MREEQGAPMSGTTSGRQRRRPDLGEFLRARRARVSPAEAGIEAGGRRRTPGLRREEVALLAGVGVTWYTWLEQGRPINASAQVLDAVAGVLQLSDAEREHLYRLAEAVPMRMVHEPGVVPSEVTEMLAAIHDLPAVVVNERWDVIASNEMHERLFWHWHSKPCVHKNLLWCCLTEPTARQKFPTYERETPYLVARMRAAFSNHLDDPDWICDIERLAALSPEFTELWGRHDVAEPQQRTRAFVHGAIGRVDFVTTELHIAHQPGLHILLYTAADEHTRRMLAQLPDPRLEASLTA